MVRSQQCCPARTLGTFIAVVGVVLLVAGTAGCTSKARPAVPTGVSSATAPSMPATAARSAATSSSGGKAGKADAAGGAVGSSLTVGSASKKPKRGGIPRPSDKAATEATVRKLRDDEQIGEVERVHVRSMTQDRKGNWWVLVAITDDMAGSNQAVVTFDGTSWENVVFGEGVSNDDLPPDVRF